MSSASAPPVAWPASVEDFKVECCGCFKLLLPRPAAGRVVLLVWGLSTFNNRDCRELRGVTGGGILGAPLGGVSDVRGATGGGGILVVVVVGFVLTESERLWIFRFLANWKIFSIYLGVLQNLGREEKK